MNKSDLQTYKQYNEDFYSTKYYNNIKHNLKVHDIVKISDCLYHDKGYEGHMGIVISLTGINEYVHIFSYNSNKEKYWVCGFNEHDLIKLPTDLENINIQLKEAYFNWLEKNCFHVFENQNTKFNNIIYFDFVNKIKY